MHLTISALYVYPIKSLGGIALSEARLTPTGFAHDRQYMLVDANNRFITQREMPQLALFETALTDEAVRVTFDGDTIDLPLQANGAHRPERDVTLFEHTLRACAVSDAIDDWFSRRLDRPVSLVAMAPDERRLADRTEDALVRFQDSSQLLVIGEQSLADLNERLPAPVGMNRFRPNIVFGGGRPYAEDDWQHITIGNDVPFEVTKPCGRCKITTVDQATGTVGEEPLRTLATYRKQGRKITFGVYLRLLNGGSPAIAVGDRIRLD